MPRTGEREQLARVTAHGAHSIRACGFVITGEGLSPARPMARRACGAKVTRMNTSPMAWTAKVMTPYSPHIEADVTVMLRVTYNTLEAIIRDEFMLTESRVAH